jgi:tRNA (guanine-N7-)-methyltransferase
MKPISTKQTLLDDATTTEETAHRRIRSFVLRQGRLTKGQERALETGLASVWHQLHASIVQFDGMCLTRIDSPKILEIGFGMGESTAKIAQTLPTHDFLAVEVHTPGVGSLLKQIQEQDIRNVRIIQHDAVEVLATHVVRRQFRWRAYFLSGSLAQKTSSQTPFNSG